MKMADIGDSHGQISDYGRIIWESLTEILRGMAESYQSDLEAETLICSMHDLIVSFDGHDHRNDLNDEAEI